MDKEADIIEQCHAYFDGLLSPEEQAQLLSRIEENPTYQQTFQQLNQVHRQLQRWAEIEPPPGLEERILQAAALEDEKPRRNNIVAIGSRWRVPMQAAAAVLLLACVGITVYLQSPVGQQSNNPVLSQQVGGNKTQAPGTFNPGTIQPGQTGLNGNTDGSMPALQQDPSQMAALPPGQGQPSPETQAEDAMLEQSMVAVWTDMEELNQEMAYMEESMGPMPMDALMMGHGEGR